MYLWLARLVIILHACAVFVLIFGGVMVLAGRFPRLHIAWRGIIITTFLGFLTSAVVLQDCVFTRWEKHLRLLSRTGPVYRGSFLYNYVPYLDRVNHRRASQAVLISLVLLASYICWKRLSRDSRTQP